MPIVVQRVLLDLGVQGTAPRLGTGIGIVRLMVARLFPQVVVAKTLFRARIKEAASTCWRDS